MLPMFLVAPTIVALVVVAVIRFLPLLLVMMMISKISRFLFYMPLLVVGIMTHSYAFGPTIGTECNKYYV